MHSLSGRNRESHASQKLEEHVVVLLSCALLITSIEQVVAIALLSRKKNMRESLTLGERDLRTGPAARRHAKHFVRRMQLILPFVPPPEPLETTWFAAFFASRFLIPPMSALLHHERRRCQKCLPRDGCGCLLAQAFQVYSIRKKKSHSSLCITDYERRRAHIMQAHKDKQCYST